MSFDLQAEYVKEWGHHAYHVSDVNALIREKDAEIERLRTRIQDEVDRNQERAFRCYELMQKTVDHVDYARVIAKAVAFQNVSHELSHILTQG